MKKKSIKKFLVILSYTVMIMALVACGAEDGKQEVGVTNDAKESNMNETVSEIPDAIEKTEQSEEHSKDTNNDKTELPLQVVVYDDKNATLFYTFEGDSKPVSCTINMRKYDVVLVDFGDGYQCDVCMIDGTSSVVVADCDYAFDGNTVIFDVDMSSFVDFAFSDVITYDTFVSFGSGGGSISYSAKDVVKQGEHIANGNDGPEPSKPNEEGNVDDVKDSHYLETEYSDGVNTIVFHGTDPAHPTSMTINGNEIVFDAVEVVQNDETGIQFGVSWLYDDVLNCGDVYYSTDDHHIVLKGFAIANEYAPVDEKNSVDGNVPSFIGVKYYNDGPTWGASEFVLKSPDENGMPTKIVISNSGVAVSGLELDGTFSIKITDYYEPDNILMGIFVGTEHDGVKGEFVSRNGDRLLIQID